uniref:helix-turn-helix domain-containing protein n=1 Tax=Limosilactobacillus reuteri TaxID=1598 RepID=UPI002B05C948
MKKNESEKEKKPHNRIAELRKDRGLTIQQVADGIGVSNGTISRYEKGTREPKLETWFKLSDYFNVPVSY